MRPFHPTVVRGFSKYARITIRSVGASSSANVFNLRGLACVNLSNGMADIHSPDEHIAVADLEAMVDVSLALLEEARAA